MALRIASAHRGAHGGIADADAVDQLTSQPASLPDGDDRIVRKRGVWIGVDNDMATFRL
jgi:hypothetical protein